jgi:hypothetical protein
VKLIPTELNQRVASALRYSAAAETFRIAGQSGFWRLVGVGLLLFGTGVAIGASFYGYSFIVRNSENISALSSSLAKAISQVRLHGTTDGTVQLEPKELPLRKGETIALSGDSRIALDPKATVRADGELRIQVPPAISPFANPTPRPNPKAPAPTIVNFTIFKTVPFDKGSVMTGWRFLTSARRTPTDQYCYYTENSETPDVNVVFDVGQNSKMDNPTNVPKGFDIVSAFNRCVWFRMTEP